jgi:NAD(P)-dependent dehydrogenase (short-subunit alcohol dehydrogenase family)
MCMERDVLSFAGKTVIVTGGNGGIGQGIVDVFSERDANVLIADIGTRLNSVTSLGKGRVIDVRTDITDRTSVDAMVARAMKEFGRIDVLINNAGRGEGMARLPDVTPHMVDWMLKLNIIGTVNCSQAVVAEMLKVGRGSIVNITSAAALSGVAGRNDPIYAGCKGFLASRRRWRPISAPPASGSIRWRPAGLSLKPQTRPHRRASGTQCPLWARPNRRARTSSAR